MAKSPEKPEPACSARCSTSGRLFTPNDRQSGGTTLNSGTLAIAGSGTLAILNFDGSDSICFGTDATGPSDTQLALTDFDEVAARIDESGFLTAVPELAACAALFGLAALDLAWFRRRRIA